ncbi:TIGR04086 family membrane protein [Acutalibacter sp. JLR.KK004]|uniref:TIGR04086 family membrane protein n=1 Tax=Acutalibacter sp. JLR.KK004 TaxID=3112622 RepID=UPI002FF13F7F
MKFIRSILLSAGAIGGSSLVLLAIIAFIIARAGVLPQGSLPLITTAAACAAAFLGGLAAALAAKEKGLYLGLASGALLAVCISVASYFMAGEVFAISGAGKIAALLASGAIGGVLGANRKAKVKF